MKIKQTCVTMKFSVEEVRLLWNALSNTSTASRMEAGMTREEADFIGVIFNKLDTVWKG